MSEFWLWVWRPIGEFIGVILLVLAITLLWAGWLIGAEVWGDIRRKMRAHKETEADHD